MLPTWHQNLESFEAISQDHLTRDLVLRMSALSQEGKLGPFLYELSEDRELDDMTKGTLAEIKDMVEAEEVKEELRATYRPDRSVEERIERVTKRVIVTNRQVQIVNTKLEAMLEMQKDLEAKLERARTLLKELEEEKTATPA